MAISKVDKNINLMKESNGTVCLITEAGRADRLLSLARKRHIKEAVLAKQPKDAWDI